MSLVQATPIVGSPAKNSELDRHFGDLCESLQLCFGADFAILDAAAGEFLQLPEHFGHLDAHLYVEHCQEVLRRADPEFIAEDDPVAWLAIPILDNESPRFAALALFVIQPADELTIARAAMTLGFDEHAAGSWARRQSAWNSRRLLHLAQLQTSQWSSDQHAQQMQREISDLSAHLAATYEEVSLLYGLTQKLRISASIEDLGQKALEWIAEAISAESFVLEWLPSAVGGADAAASTRRESVFLRFGQGQVDRFQLARLVEHLHLDGQTKTQIINDALHHDPDWPVANVRDAVIVPLAEGENLFGWLAAINHNGQTEFGSSEASLLSSVAAILGIHAGNRELYRQQAEFLADVVRALSSAIDAKDPYTCGHSDRVARIAVRLADYLGCGPKDLETIYLSGLLHDIGKIGIDDHVLRKPGKLTEIEYEHIKMHAEIGYRILRDLKRLGQVLPVVRHHHEAVNGSGYPLGLSGDEIPFFARIVAVADAFDAMSSDRPYRKGMEDDKLDEILRAGAGQQWDQQVVDAFFAVRDDIRQISRNESHSGASELLHIS